ncbi:MAG TPA: biotin/lipoyl-containing protein [Terracidiphilus sp.]
MKLRIRIEGKTYDVEVEVLDGQESAPEYPPYPPVQSVFAPATLPEPPISAKTDIEENPKECRSPVTGMVIKVNVETGQTVLPNEVVIVLESMKMEMQIAAPQGGIVKNVLVAPGAAVKVSQIMVQFE